VALTVQRAIRSSERVAIRENLVELSSLRQDEDPSGTENRKRSTKKTRIIQPCWEPGYYNPTVYVSLLSETFGFNCVYYSIQTETEVNPQRLKTNSFEQDSSRSVLARRPFMRARWIGARPGMYD
jgi:hypothetical protein